MGYSTKHSLTYKLPWSQQIASLSHSSNLYLPHVLFNSLSHTHQNTSKVHKQHCFHPHTSRCAWQVMSATSVGGLHSITYVNVQTENCINYGTARELPLMSTTFLYLSKSLYGIHDIRTSYCWKKTCLSEDCLISCSWASPLEPYIQFFMKNNLNMFRRLYVR